MADRWRSSKFSLCTSSCSVMLWLCAPSLLCLLLAQWHFSTKNAIAAAKANLKDMYDSQNAVLLLEVLAKSSDEGHIGWGIWSQWSWCRLTLMSGCVQFSMLTLKYSIGFMLGASTPSCQVSTSVASNTGAKANVPMIMMRVSMAARVARNMSLYKRRKTPSTAQ